MLQENHIICWQLNSSGEGGEKSASRRKRQLSFNATFSVFCRNNYKMQIFIHLCGLHLHFYWYKHMHFNSILSFYKSICLWLLWVSNSAVQNVFTFFIICIYYLSKYLNCFSLGVTFCFQVEFLKLNSVSDHLLIVFVPWAYLYGTTQGHTLPVHDF